MAVNELVSQQSLRSETLQANLASQITNGRVAVVDDSAEFTEVIKAALESRGFVPSVHSSSTRFLMEFHHESYDALIVDWMMPEVSGIEVVRLVREVRPDMPVIMLTCRANDRDIVEGLQAGADDYVVKPVSDEVLLSRVEALLRRVTISGQDRDAPPCIGPYQFDDVKLTVRFGADAVVLTNREYGLARLFFSNPNRPLSRQYILDRLWGKRTDLQTRTIDTHIARLRMKLRLGSKTGVKLNTLYGFGYKLEILAINT